MAKIEVWFLDKFLPWLMYACQYIGLLFLFYQIDPIAALYLGWTPGHTFGGLIVISFILVNTCKDRRLKRAIHELLDDEGGKVMLICNGSQINRSVLDSITSKITRKLREDGLDEIDDTYQKVETELWQRFYQMRKKEPHGTSQPELDNLDQEK